MATLGGLDFGQIRQDGPNAWIDTANKIGAMRQQQLANDRAQALLPYAGPSAQAQLQQMLLGNQKSEAEMPYWAKQAAAELAYKQAQAPYLQAQTQKELTENRFIPEKYKNEAINARAREIMAALAGRRLNVAEENAGLKATTNPILGPQIASNPGLLNSITGLANNIFAPFGEVQPNPQQQANQPGQAGVPQQNQTPSQNLSPEQVDQVKSKDPENLSDEQFNARRNILFNEIKKTGGAPFLKRIQAGIALDNLLSSPETTDAIKTIASFKGRFGTGWIKEAAGWARNDPKYLAMDSARRQLQGLVSGGLSALEAYPTSNKGIQQAKSFFEKAEKDLTSSPEAAKIDFQQGIKLMKAEDESLLNTYGLGLKDFVRNKSNQSGVITIIDSNGEEHSILKKNLSAAKKRDPNLRVKGG